MLSGQWYRPVDAQLAAERRACQRALAAFNSHPDPEAPENQQVLDEILGDRGQGSVIMPRLRLDYGYNLHIGRDCFINYDLIALDCAPIYLGDGVLIGPGCQLLTPIHPVDDIARRRAGWERAEPITIGDNVWLGGGVIVNPGVTIGAGSVIGSGAVVTRDIPAGVFAAGTPARIIRELQPDCPPSPPPTKDLPT